MVQFYFLYIALLHSDVTMPKRSRSRSIDGAHLRRLHRENMRRAREQRAQHDNYMDQEPGQQRGRATTCGATYGTGTRVPAQ